MDLEMRATFEGPVAAGSLKSGVNKRPGLGLMTDELVTSLTLFTIAVISLAVCCTIAFVSFPSGHMYFYTGNQ